jgi:outer membrane phospholipase A
MRIGGARFRSLAASLLSAICLLFAAAGAGEPHLLLQVRPGPYVEGGSFRASAFLLNTNTAPGVYQIPESIPWELRDGVRTTGGALNRIGAEAEVRLEPGAFHREEYEGQLPLGWSGNLAVEAPAGRGARFLIEIAAAHEPQQQLTGPAPAPRRPDVPPVDMRESPGQLFFRRHFAGYEPLYFVWGPESPNVKFQVSFRYKIINPEAELGRWWAWSHGLNIAYSQTSLWDLDAPSAPFFDSSYRPEFLWRADSLLPGESLWWRDLRLQLAVQHESNGRDDADSRSLNIVYLRPTFVFGNETNFIFELSPRLWTYWGGLGDNPDLREYRGYADLHLKAGWIESLQVAGIFRAGNDFEHGSLQLDATYPTGRFLGAFDLFLHLQYFNGWGESLLRYDERTWAIRAGISLYR